MFKVSLFTHQYDLLSGLVGTIQQAAKSTYGNKVSLSLSKSMARDLLERLADEQSEKGLGPDDEPNSYGFQIEAIIDEINDDSLYD